MFSPADFANLIVGLVGVLIGFLLAIGWDQYKTARDQNAEFRRAVRSLRAETKTNSEIIKSNLKNLNADVAAADEGKEVILPTDPLILSAMETVYLKESLETKGVNLAVELHQVYSAMRVANQRMVARDLYRATNQAMSNFAPRRKVMDEDIIKRLTEIQSQQKHLMTQLDSSAT